MAYEIIGNVHKIGTTESIQTRSGSTFQRRSITLIQRRFDQNTGEEFEPNFPTIDFTREKCGELDRYKPGDRVRIRFDVSGAKYLDKNTGEEKYFNSLRGFRIEPYVQPNAQTQAQYTKQTQNYAQAGQWKQPAPQPKYINQMDGTPYPYQPQQTQGYAQQQAQYPQQGAGYQQAHTSQSQGDDLPF